MTRSQRATCLLHQRQPRLPARCDASLSCISPCHQPPLLHHHLRGAATCLLAIQCQVPCRRPSVLHPCRFHRALFARLSLGDLPLRREGAVVSKHTQGQAENSVTGRPRACRTEAHQHRVVRRHSDLSQPFAQPPAKALQFSPIHAPTWTRSSLGLAQSMNF